MKMDRGTILFITIVLTGPPLSAANSLDDQGTELPLSTPDTPTNRSGILPQSTREARDDLSTVLPLSTIESRGSQSTDLPLSTHETQTAQTTDLPFSTPETPGNQSTVLASSTPDTLGSQSTDFPFPALQTRDGQSTAVPSSTPESRGTVKPEPEPHDYIQDAREWFSRTWDCATKRFWAAHDRILRYVCGVLGGCGGEGAAPGTPRAPPHTTTPGHWWLQKDNQSPSQVVANDFTSTESSSTESTTTEVMTTQVTVTESAATEPVTEFEDAHHWLYVIGGAGCINMKNNLPDDVNINLWTLNSHYVPTFICNPFVRHAEDVFDKRYRLEKRAFAVISVGRRGSTERELIHDLRYYRKRIQGNMVVLPVTCHAAYGAAALAAVNGKLKAECSRAADCIFINYPRDNKRDLEGPLWRVIFRIIYKYTKHGNVKQL